MIRSSLACSAALLAILALLTGCGSSSSADPAGYRVEFTDWPQIERHKQVDGYVESAWRDPAYTYVIFAIDSRPADETGSPMANAQLARIQTTKLTGYRERGIRWIRLNGRPAVRWAFDVADRAHIEYFFEECGTSFLVRGTSGLYGFSSLSETFREKAVSIKTACHE